MNAHTRQSQQLEPSRQEFELGFFDYQARCAVRDLIRLHGPDAAREILDNILTTEVERRSHA